MRPAQKNGDNGTGSSVLARRETQLCSTHESSHSAEDQIIEARRARGMAMGKKNNLGSKRAKLSGAASTSVHVSDRSQTTAMQINDFGGAHAIVLEQALPDAARLLAADLERGAWVKRRGFVSDAPPSLHKDAKRVRESFDLRQKSMVAAALDKGPLQQLRAALGVRMVERVGLKSAVSSASPRIKHHGMTPRQIGHFDYSRTCIGTWHARVAVRRVPQTSPWTLLVSLQDGGEILVWCHQRWVAVELQAGDAFLFRGDVWHAGAGYKVDHFRLHEYWVPTEHDEDLDFRLGDHGELALHGVEGENTWKFPEVCNPAELVYTGPRFSVDTALRSAGVSRSAFPLGLKK